MGADLIARSYAQVVRPRLLRSGAPGGAWPAVAVADGETVEITTSRKDFYDTILLLLAPDGTPVLASDDYAGYFAGFEWVAPAAGTYRLRVTSFEGVSTGELVVARK